MGGTFAVRQFSFTTVLIKGKFTLRKKTQFFLDVQSIFKNSLVGLSLEIWNSTYPETDRHTSNLALQLSNEGSKNKLLLLDGSRGQYFKAYASISSE